MALIPWRPKDLWWDSQHDLDSLQRQINSLFSLAPYRGNYGDGGLLEGAWNPALDMYDSKDCVIVHIDMPGMKKEDIDISVSGKTLTIKGEKKESNRVEDEGCVRTERFYGTFNRAITLPAVVDANKVQAAYKDGVLELTLPKKEESKPRQIKVDVK